MRQGLDHGDGAQAPRRRMEALDLARSEEIAVEIALELFLDAGPQHLDGHVAAHTVVDHNRLVHLGDGGSGNGRTEFGEMILQLAAELLLDRLARLGHGERRQPVLQVAQIACELRPDQIGAGGEELAELDVAGAEAGDGAGDAPRLGLAGAERPGENADGQRGGAGQVERERHLGARRHEAHAMLRQHEAGARKAEDVADGCGHERREGLCGSEKSLTHIALARPGVKSRPRSCFAARCPELARHLK